MPIALALRRAGRLRQMRGWDRLLRLLFPPDEQKEGSLSFRLFGRPYLGTTASYLDWSAFFYGAYEAGELALVAPVLEALNEPVILDVGANAGHHAFFFSQFGTVHAVEPSPSLTEKLIANIDCAGLGHRVTVHPVGLGDESGVLPFALPDDGNNGTGTFAQKRNGRQIAMLPVRNGDSLLREAGVDHVDFIKVDVEGHEFAVLTGLAETIRRDRPAMWIEVSSDDPTRRVDRRFIRALGDYRIKAFTRTGRITTDRRLVDVDEVPAGLVDILCLPAR